MIGRPISLSYLPWPSSVHIKSCTPAYTALTVRRHGSIETTVLRADRSAHYDDVQVHGGICLVFKLNLVLLTLCYLNDNDMKNV
jgi:hypothetical protein